MTADAVTADDGPRTWVVPVSLFLIAAALRLAVATLVPFPATEGSAYYVGVARNILDGDGLVTDSLWSYATPPLGVPRPAFELWMPMSSFVAAAGMAAPRLDLLGRAGRQLPRRRPAGAAHLGRWLAPRHERPASIDAARLAVAFAAGLLVALGEPVRALGGRARFVHAVRRRERRGGAARPGRGDGRAGSPVARGLALGVLLGLAYLARQEVVWLGLAVVVATWVGIRRASGSQRALGRRVDVRPWRRSSCVSSRSWSAGWSSCCRGWFGTPPRSGRRSRARRSRTPSCGATRTSTRSRSGRRSPATSTRASRTLLGNPVAAAWDGLLNVLVLPAFPIGIVGLVAIVRDAPIAGLRADRRSRRAAAERRADVRHDDPAVPGRDPLGHVSCTPPGRCSSR